VPWVQQELLPAFAAFGGSSPGIKSLSYWFSAWTCEVSQGEIAAPIRLQEQGKGTVVTAALAACHKEPTVLHCYPGCRWGWWQSADSSSPAAASTRVAGISQHLLRHPGHQELHNGPAWWSSNAFQVSQ